MRKPRPETISVPPIESRANVKTPEFNKLDVISKAKFSELSRIPQHKVSKLLIQGWGCILNGKRVMQQHPLAKWAIEAKDPSARPPASFEKYMHSARITVGSAINTGVMGDVITKLPDHTVNLDSIMDFSLREATELYGTCDGMKNYMQSVKLIEEIKEKRLKNMGKIGELVPRNLVKISVISLLEALNRRLLTDIAKSLATRLRAAPTHEAAEETAKKLISQALNHAKADIDRKLKGLKAAKSSSAEDEE